MVNRKSGDVMNLSVLLDQVDSCMQETTPLTKTQSKIEIPLYVARFVDQLMVVVVTRRTLGMLSKKIKVLHKGPASADSIVSACLGRKDLKSQVPVASGHFGEVYRIAQKKAGGGHLAVKVVNMDPMKGVEYWNTRGNLHVQAKSLIREVKWATLAGKMGVGPHVHDAFVCVRGDIPYGVTVMDFVEGGIKLSEWRTIASKADVSRADKLAIKKLAKLHSVGVIHGDLHAGNIMVVPKVPKKEAKTAPRGVSDVWIVDYGFAVDASDWKTAREAEDLDDMQKLVDGRMPRVETQIATIARRMVVKGYIKLDVKGLHTFKETF